MKKVAAVLVMAVLVVFIAVPAMAAETWVGFNGGGMAGYDGIGAAASVEVGVRTGNVGFRVTGTGMSATETTFNYDQNAGFFVTTKENQASEVDIEVLAMGDAGMLTFYVGAGAGLVLSDSYKGANILVSAGTRINVSKNISIDLGSRIGAYGVVGTTGIIVKF